MIIATFLIGLLLGSIASFLYSKKKASVVVAERPESLRPTPLEKMENPQVLTVEYAVEFIKSQKREDLLSREFTLEEAYELLRSYKTKLKIDPTKRKSLQPGAMPGGVPAELDEILSEDQKIIRSRIEELQRAERERFVPATAHSDLEHKFYGTSVTIGRWSRSGLDKKLHILEVIQNQLFIDQQPQPCNPSDLEHIKQVLQAQVEANG